MKKIILFVLIVIGFQTAKSQVYVQRYALANKDTVRIQARMGVIEEAKLMIDTATGNNLRLCIDVLADPTASHWLDKFMYPLAAIAPTDKPTDAQVKAGIKSIWFLVAFLNTRR